MVEFDKAIEDDKISVEELRNIWQRVKNNNSITSECPHLFIY
jgi:hypothetical protein